MKTGKKISVEEKKVEESKLKIGKGKIPPVEVDEETVTLKGVQKDGVKLKKNSIGAKEDTGPSGPLLKLRKASVETTQPQAKTSKPGLKPGEPEGKKKKKSATQQAEQMFGVKLKGRAVPKTAEAEVDFGVDLKAFGRKGKACLYTGVEKTPALYKGR